MASHTLKENDAAKAQRREQLFAASKFNAFKSKFGLFSFTGTLAISKTPHYTEPPSRKGADGSILIGPKNFLTSPARKGKTVDSLFSLVGLASVGEPYKDPVLPQASEQEKAAKMRKLHPAAFKSSGRAAVTGDAGYLRNEEPAKKSLRDAEGSVKTAPRNFYSARGIPALKEDFLVPAGPSKKERAKGHPKVHECAFRAPSLNGGLFADSKATFGAEGALPWSPVKLLRPVSNPHERMFVPTGNTRTMKNEGTFGSYPEHMADPPLPSTRKAPAESVPFRVPGISGGVPSPSITLNMKNIRVEHPKHKL